MRPRLFLQVVSVEARSQMSYRVDFWMNAVVSFIAQIALMYFLWQAVFHESGATRIHGYDLPGILLYYVLVILYGNIVRGPQLQGVISTDIYEGGLNRYLVFPTSYFAFKYAQNLGRLLPAIVQLVLFGLVYAVVIHVPDGVAITPWTVLMGLTSVAFANLLFFVMSYPIQAVAFWADNVWSLAVAMRFLTSLLGGLMIPLRMFPEWSQGPLHWLPFRFLYDFPANVTLGHVSTASWLEGLVLCLGWTAVLGLLGRVVWRRGDLQYSGVGI